MSDTPMVNSRYPIEVLILIRYPGEGEQGDNHYSGDREFKRQDDRGSEHHRDSEMPRSVHIRKVVHLPYYNFAAIYLWDSSRLLHSLVSIFDWGPERSRAFIVPSVRHSSSNHRSSEVSAGGISRAILCCGELAQGESRLRSMDQPTLPRTRNAHGRHHQSLSQKQPTISLSVYDHGVRTFSRHALALLSFSRLRLLASLFFRALVGSSLFVCPRSARRRSCRSRTRTPTR